MRLCETFPWTCFTALAYLSRSAESWPQAQLTADPPGSDVLLGEKVTLTCRVTGSEGWKYFWTRETNGAISDLLGSSGQDGETYILQPVMKTDQGLYQCRGKRGHYSFSNYHSLQVHDVSQAVIRQNPPAPVWFSGETVTLECDIRGGSGWRYSWAKRTTQTGLQSLTPQSTEAQKNYIVQSVKVSDSGEYICQAERGSDPVIQSQPGSLYLSVSGEKPEAVITWTSDVGETYTGERISLSCRVRGASSGWKYLWYKDRQGTELSNPDNSRTDGSSYTIISAALSHSGQYWCRAQRGSFYSQYSDPLQVDIHDLPQALLTLQSGWTDLFPTERVTLRCELQGDSTQWEYKWYRDGQELPADESDSSRAERNIYIIHSAGPSHPGKYQCSGRSTRGSVNSPISDPVTLTVHSEIPKPEPSLNSSHGETYTGERVSLSCRVRGASSGWKYLWYKDRQGTELSNPDNSSTDESSYTIISAALSHSGQYWCRAQRGSFYSQYSDPLQVDIHDLPQALLTLQPGWTDLFPTERVTLRCELQVDSTQWEYKWYRDGQELPADESDSSSVNEDTYIIPSADLSHAGSYQCSGRPTRAAGFPPLSNSILLSVNTNVPESLISHHNFSGDIYTEDRVTFSCMVEGGSVGWKYLWYKDRQGTELSNPDNSRTDGTSYTIISAALSHSGQYWCRAQRGSFYSQYSDPLQVDIHDVAQAVIRQNPPGPVWFSGETMTLECDIRGLSGWRYSWAKRTTQTGLQSLTHQSTEAQKNYIVQSAKVSDSGEYICQAERGSDSVIQSQPGSLYLSVSGGKPEAVITWTSHEGETYTGERISLSCRVRGASSGWKYLWYKDRQGTELSNPYNSRTDGSSYTIISAALSHSGQYWCRAQRGSFYSQYSDALQVHIHDLPQALLTLQAGWTDLFPTERVTLRCELQRDSTQWEYKWYRDGQELPADESDSSSVNEDTYIIPSADLSHAGSYQCSGRPTRGTVDSPVSGPVTLTVQSEIPKPELSLNSSHGETYTGERISLSCRVRGASSGWKYLWYKDRQGTELSNPHNSMTDGSSYTIISAALSHSGQYWCWAQRGSFYSQYSDALQVDIHDLPQALLTLQPGWTDLFPTERVTLRCELQRDSTQWEYKWYRDGQELPADESDSSRAERNIYMIHSAGPSHPGKYQCSGRSTRGSVSSPISDPVTLTLHWEIPKPELSFDSSHGETYTGERISLSCRVRGASSGWKYLWYKDRQGTELSNPDNSRTDGSSYTIISAALSHSGQYWCRAQRGSFYSQYSDALQVHIHDLPQALLTLQPGWTDLFPTERVTLRCELQRDSTQWEYKWYRDGQELPADESDSSSVNEDTHIIPSADLSHAGSYQCSGRPTRAAGFPPLSNSILLSVNATLPESLLSHHNFSGDIYTEDRVTFSCMVEGGSVGWKYLWYKDRQGTELSNPDNSSTDESSYTIISAALSHSGVYWCRAQRGSFYSQYSDPLLVHIHAHPQAVLAVDTGFLQILTKDSLTLRCEVEGSSVRWSYTWYADGSQLPEDQDGQNFTVRSGNDSYHREYKCRGNTTEKPFYSTFSNGLVPNVIVLLHILVISTSGFVLLSVITLTLVCLIRRRKSGQNKKMHDNELYVSSLGMKSINVGRRTTAIYEEVDDNPGKVLFLGLQEQSGFDLYSTIQKIY
ncbi:basement membrane-specific heparan sulfate proteoglycan core protein-like [Paramormyrops kingsleyae]|uniref:basement membrane-specific heparan sulfate proteoglycan core protein-like n=1 Tax=Paramormyrops kingsleyae TaxID=1676925 RepID=UPI003B970DC6